MLKSLVPKCALAQLLQHVILSYAGATGELVRCATILPKVWRYCHHSLQSGCRNWERVRVMMLLPALKRAPWEGAGRAEAVRVFVARISATQEYRHGEHCPSDLRQRLKSRRLNGNEKSAVMMRTIMAWPARTVQVTCRSEIQHVIARSLNHCRALTTSTSSCTLRASCSINSTVSYIRSKYSTNTKTASSTMAGPGVSHGHAGAHPIHIHPVRPLYRFFATALPASMWFFVCLD